MLAKRVIQPGHVAAILFVTLLLVGARTFLGTHPILAGLLLAAFAPAYYFAARITRYREFLYPAVLLLVLAYHLVLHGAGVALALQPLGSLIAVAVIYLAAVRGLPRKVERAAESFYGSNDLLISVFVIWILVRVPWFFGQAPVSTGLTLAGYAVYSWLRFRHTERVPYALATSVLGSGAFLYLLYSHSSVTLFLGTTAALWLASELFQRGVLGRFETFAFALVGAYLLASVFIGTREVQLPLGYLVLAQGWMLLALALYRPEEQPTFGPHPAALPRVLPLFTAGILLGLLPVALFYPWKPQATALSYLTIFFVVFLATAREFGKNAMSLLGVALARLLAGLGRTAPVAALVYLAVARFPASYHLALAALSIGFLSLLAGWRQGPRVLVRRNIYVYQAGVFLTVAYFLAERQLAPVGALGALLDSGALLVLALIGLGYALRRHLPEPYLQSLYDVSHVAAAAACAVAAVERGQLAFGPALWTGGLLLVACGLAFIKVRRIAVLFTVPVVLGYWVYVAQWTVGVRGETLGMPYFVWGFVAAAIGYVLLRRSNPWYELFYFMWFFCTGISLALFFPYHGIGAYAAPLWPLAFLLIARATTARRDFPFALVMEILSGVLAAASVAVLLYDRFYTPAALALFVYALLYGWVAVRSKLWFYLYPAAFSAVAAYFLMVLRGPGARLFLPYFLPLAIVLYALAALLRRRGLAQQACPFNLATSTAAAVGTLLFVLLPFGAFVTAGWIAGLSYLVLYLLLTHYTPERVFLAGAGLAGALTVYELLPLVPVVTPANRLAYFIPFAMVLALVGWRRQRAQDSRGGWALYAAAIAATSVASLFALWPAPDSTAASRVVLMVAMAVWLALLLWTESEIFIYCATLALAMVAYNFVQSSADVFGQHLVAFFLYGAALVGLVFLAAVARNVVRFRRPVLFVTPAEWYRRFLYLAPVGLLALATFGSWGVTTSSNPHFCGTCHDMNTYFANWKSSAHARAGVGCADCHIEPGLRGYLRAKTKGTSELVITLTGTQGFKPVAMVGNESCLASNCHSTGQIARRIQVASKYSFNHSVHLGDLGRGPKLRCTSCHTDVAPETHFSVDTNTCFTCHFQAASEPRPATSAGCVGCHGIPQGARGTSGFDHVSSGVAAADDTCMSCHAQLTRGSTAVEERQCRHCHLERASKLLTAGSTTIHEKHVSQKAINCDWCHGAIKHGGP